MLRDAKVLWIQPLPSRRGDKWDQVYGAEDGTGTLTWGGEILDHCWSCRAGGEGWLCPRTGLEVTRSVAGPTHGAILCRAAGTGEGIVAVSTLDSLDPGWGEGAGEHQRHHLAPGPCCAMALCHVSLAPVFLCSLCIGVRGKPLICRINRIREVLFSAGSLPWGATSQSHMVRLKPCSLPAARPEDLLPALARPWLGPSPLAGISRGRDSLCPGLPLATLGGGPDSSPSGPA